MTTQIDSTYTKPDLQAGLGDVTRFTSLRTEHPRSLVAFRVERPVRPETRGTRIDELGMVRDHKQAIEEALDKLLRSSLLVQSNRLSRFLSFAVETTLKGDSSSLKEYTIGIEAYGRRGDFDPTQDSIVRTEARRLRNKLAQYYQDEGLDDPIFIHFRPGSYVPVFHVNDKSRHQAIERSMSRQTSQQGVSLFVVPFSHLCGDSLGEACARGLTDEVMHCLAGTQQLRVFTSSTVLASPQSEDSVETNRGTQINFEGTVRTEGNRIRVTSRIFNISGLHIASWRMDAETTPGGLFADLEKIALKIVGCMHNYCFGTELSFAS